MPLFGHKNKNRNTSPLGGTTRTDPVNTQAAAGSNPNTGANWDQTNTGPNANRVNEPGFHDPNNYGAQQQGAAGYGSTQGNTGFGANEHPVRSGDYAGTGTADAAAGTGAGTGLGGGRTHHHQGAAGAGTGQGGHLSSAALREQAMLKEREAQDFHAQSAELAEAERLEQEAREHRTRAVAQGAHPSHKHLAGGNSGQNAGFDQTRAGNY